MKKIAMLATAFLTSVAMCFAQTPVKDEAGLKTKMQTAAKSVTSIQSDFVQEKYMSAMGNSMKSSGKFYYKKEDKVALQYTVPFKQNMVMNGTKLMMEVNGKKNVMDASSNPMMGELKKVISACMSGNIADMGSNYQLSFFETDEAYMVKIVPQSADVKKFASEVELYLDKKDFSVVKMKMIESLKNGQKKNDYTLYTFTNKKTNAAIADSVFTIK